MDKIRVLVADRNSFVADGICAVLKANETIDAIGVVVSSEEIAGTVKGCTPDIVLMDTAMTDGDGAGIIESIRRASSGTRILLMTEHEDRERIVKGFRMGSHGCILKRASSEDLIFAILAVHQGGYFLYPSIAKTMVGEYMRVLKGPNADPYDRLTPHEKLVLKTLAQGHKSREIARSLNMTSEAVARHRARIMLKLGVHNQTDLVKYALRRHLIEL